ncbi:restriction endonuclease subunit S [Methanocaldococcus sp. 10A]
MEFYKETRFKNSEIGEVPEDWKVVRLEDIAEKMYYGITAKAVNYDTGLKMVRTTDIINYKVDWENLPFCEITDNRKDFSKYLIKKDDILISRAGTVGISVLSEQDYNNVIFGSYLIKLQLKPKAFPKYVHYFLQSEHYWKHIGKAQGSTLKNINLPLLKSLIIPLPPIEEQQKIAEILRKTDEAIQKVDESIEKFEKLKKGLMNILLNGKVRAKVENGKIYFYKETKFKKSEVGEVPEDWEVVRLIDVAEYINGYAFSPKDWKDKGLPIIRIQNLNDPKAEFNYFDGVIDNKYIVENGDILFSWSASIGVYIWNRGRAVLNQHIFKVVPKNNVNKLFLYYALFLAIEQLKNRVHGSTMKHFKRSELNTTFIPLPPLEEQKAIAEILSKIDKVIQLKKEKKEKLQKIKKWFMGNLLTGKVRIRL